LIPELLGRIPVVTFLKPLDASALRQILTEPKNAIIKQYKSMFDLEGVRLYFEDEALDYITHKAIEFKLGGRGLRSICETIMIDAMFDIPSQKESDYLVIDLPFVKDKIEKGKFAYLKVA
jgi:ATP-dependent Clp protease ATP-binding subunit ClpX